MHRWQQPFTRRRLIGTVASGPGVALGSGLGSGGIRLPLPGGVTTPFGVFIHHFPAGSANEPSQIWDFNGLVANTRALGGGTGANTVTGDDFRMLYALDMGVMQGLYIGQENRRHLGYLRVPLTRSLRRSG